MMKAAIQLISQLMGACLLVALCGCRGAEDPQDAGLFSDVTASLGIDFSLVNGATGERFVNETMVGGAGWIDYDGDGWLDLYLANGHEASSVAEKPGTAGNRLYRNLSGGGFEDVTAKAGVGDRRYSNGVAVADYDNDGDQDLFVANVGRNTLYRNRGDGSFEDVTAGAGLEREGFGASATWFDYDGDEFLDLFVVRYLEYIPHLARPCVERGNRVYCHPRLFNGQADLLYRNRGDGGFEDVSRKAGLSLGGPTDGKGLGVLAADFDGDGLQDLYVANDTTANFLWRNKGDGTFVDVAYDWGVALSSSGRTQAGMGVDGADINGDGWLEIHVTNFSRETNNLFMRKAPGSYTEGIQVSRLGRSFDRLGFGTVFGDYDLDGDLDLAIANGHVDDLVEVNSRETGISYRQPPDLLINDGAGSFSSATDAGRPFEKSYVGRGLASADFDNDGDLDLLLCTIDRGAVLLRNNLNTREKTAANYLSIRLVGSSGPRDAYGSTVVVEAGGRSQLFLCQAGRSYLCSLDPRINAGLGGSVLVDKVTITWPGGRTQVLRDLPANQQLIVEEPRQ